MTRKKSDQLYSTCAGDAEFADRRRSLRIRLRDAGPRDHQDAARRHQRLGADRLDVADKSVHGRFDEQPLLRLDSDERRDVDGANGVERRLQPPEPGSVVDPLGVRLWRRRRGRQRRPLRRWRHRRQPDVLRRRRFCRPDGRARRRRRFCRWRAGRTVSSESRPTAALAAQRLSRCTSRRRTPTVSGAPNRRSLPRSPAPSRADGADCRRAIRALGGDPDQFCRMSRKARP